jgi:ABC-2 type transport system permease protein
MRQALRRRTNTYGAVLAMVPKFYLAYRAWVWTEFAAQILSMTIFVFFWRAIFAASTGTIGGLNLQQTLNYVLIAQTLMPLVQNRLIFNFGWMLREGQVAVDLLRPIDFQGRFYVDALGNLALALLLKVPLVILAVVVFGLQLPVDPFVWLVFLVALVLGQAVLFFFDWIFACLAFYSTETWGLSVVRVAVGTFFSGALVPLSMMPDWLQAITNALPFAQAVYVPVSFLSGITPPGDAPRVWLIQILWLIGLAIVSRKFFNVAVRKVTVQGG